MSYVVWVDDNFHHGDADERYWAGEFADVNQAIERCREIVDDYLRSALKPGMAAGELWESYKCFGEDPFIKAPYGPPVRFSAWDYARVRCVELCPETG